MIQQSIIAALISVFLSAGSTPGCRTKSNQNSQADKPSTSQREDKALREIKTVAEGYHSSIERPFLAVVRDAETYVALRQVEVSLPPLEDEFFKSNAIVLAFLGERNTGGYSIEITRPFNSLLILDKVPAKGTIVPQMITSPFKVVSVPVTGASALKIEVSPAFSNAWSMYHVTSGKFLMTGGIAGVRESFDLQGDVLIMRHGTLATFWFIVRSSSEGTRSLLMDVATGVVQSDGQVAINKMSADSLINFPNPGLRATGAFMDAEGKLSLSFNSLPPMIADGYMGQGSLEAEITRSKP